MGMRLPKDVEAKAMGLAGSSTSGAGDLWGVFAAVRAAGFPDPIPEYQFAPPRKWRFDWCWPGPAVALEREGGEFRPLRCPTCGFTKRVFVSRHHSRDGLEADAEKYNTAAVLGWLLIRVTPGMIRDGRAADAVLAALAASTDR